MYHKQTQAVSKCHVTLHKNTMCKLQQSSHAKQLLSGKPCSSSMNQILRSKCKNRVIRTWWSHISRCHQSAHSCAQNNAAVASPKSVSKMLYGQLIAYSNVKRCGAYSNRYHALLDNRSQILDCLHPMWILRETMKNILTGIYLNTNTC